MTTKFFFTSILYEWEEIRLDKPKFWVSCHMKNIIKIIFNDFDETLLIENVIVQNKLYS